MAARPWVLITAAVLATAFPVSRAGEPLQGPKAGPLEAFYAQLDAQLAARDARRPWVPATDIAGAVQAASPGASVAATGCAVDFCRFTVRHAAGQDLRKFGERLTDHPAVPAGVAFRYLERDPLLTVIYVMRPNGDQASAAWVRQR